MQQYHWLKQLLRDFYFNPGLFVLTLFIVVAASGSVDKTVSTGAVIRAKRGTEPGVDKLLSNYQTGGYKFRHMSGWYGRIGSQPSFR